MLAVIDAHVTIDVKEPHGLAAQLYASPGQSIAKLSGASRGGQAGQFAPQCFDFRCPVQSQHTPETLRRILLQILGRLMRHSAISNSVSKLVRNP